MPFLGEGNTPLIPSRRIGPVLGLNHLYFKHEGCNPTGAFKDRGASLVAALALEAGAKGVVTASSGIWVEPAAVVSATALRSLAEQGWIKPHERVVCLLTGAGFKDSKLAEAEAEAISSQIPVPFDVNAIVAEVRK
jgi:threonine synthase